MKSEAEKLMPKISEYHAKNIPEAEESRRTFCLDTEQNRGNNLVHG